MILVGQDAARDDLVVRGARVLDPTEGIDAVARRPRRRRHDRRSSATGLDANGHRVIDGDGLVLAPAFVDPHVHLRTPGREDEETIASGTAAAAAGGYCAILAMPNTDPVVDTTDVLRGLRARAPRTRREIPVGFTAAITIGPGGHAADRDGRARRRRRGRVHRRRPPGRDRRADAPRARVQRDHRPPRSRSTARSRRLTRGGHMHMGAVSAELGLGGWPSLGESLGVARELSLAGDTGQPLHLMHLSARESVELLARARAPASRRAAR